MESVIIVDAHWEDAETSIQAIPCCGCEAKLVEPVQFFYQDPCGNDCCEVRCPCEAHR